MSVEMTQEPVTSLPAVNPVTRLPVLPVRSGVLFPRLVMPLAAGRPSSIAAVETAASTEEKTLLVVAQKDPTKDDVGFDDLCSIGTVAVIKKMQRGDEGMQLIVQGLARARLQRATRTDPYLEVEIERLTQPTDWDMPTEAAHRQMLDVASHVLEYLHPQAQAGVSQLLAEIKEPLQQAYLLTSMLTMGLDKEQSVLAAPTQAEGLRLVHDYLAHELQVLELRQKIASEAQTEMGREQREYFLRQQMRAIQEELGEQGPEQAEIAELRKVLAETELPPAVRQEADRELDRLERIPSAAPDYQLTRTYLEFISELPWFKRTADVLDLKRARQILDEDHYDLKEIKERILEHLAVLALNPRAKAPILCYVGPPGVGKTSLGQSIARALGRQFARMSLGGLYDEAELRGHRRTYVGAMPGRILQAIRRAGVCNPLLMLDEVDKLGRDFRGDPAAALLEILDPAQNRDFRDNYLDLPFDLSQVFFICTANTLDPIPQPLLDRMEVLQLAGYSDEEKQHIARRYLIPRQSEQNGLTAEQWTLPDEALARVIRRYTREAGVRDLERQLGRVCRKIATRIAQGETASTVVEVDHLGEFLGPEKFFAEDLRQEMGPGVAAGLAWTPAGGEVLYVEAVRLSEGSGLTLTGHLGDVMKESATAARSYVLSRAEQLDIDSSRLGGGVHIHVPAGATPKDGPSAGVTMATVLASLYSGLPARRDTAMTGEITLTGLVLPVGGVKEKVLAAHRAGLRRVLLPKQNEKDLGELPEHVRRALEFHFVQHLDEVFADAIPGLAERMTTPEALTHAPR